MAGMFSLVPADGDQPVRWTLRSDLQIVPAPAGSRTEWVIKDPIRLSYFQAPAEELAFLRLLDGRRSLDQAQQELQQQFPGACFAPANLRQFLASAIQGGLLRSTQAGFGSWLHATHLRRRARGVRQKMMSLLVHRFRGIDPTFLLRAIHPWTGWMFRRDVMLALTVFTVSIALLVLSRMRELQMELPGVLVSLMTIDNLPLLLVAVVVVKVLHELGHALTCHHFGGECHELGILLVGIMPLFYCDVSDTWTQQDRWKRMLVAAAGIFVELFLAALFGLLWMLSIPGMLHAFFLNAMMVCSINTLLINGNPLLRYDGYYVLCDLLRIPNLGSVSRSVFAGGFCRLVLGVPNPTAGDFGRWKSVALGLWGLATVMYRLVVITLVLLGIHHLLKSAGLEAVTPVLAASAGGGQLAALFFSVRGAWVSSEDRSRFVGGLVVAVVLSAVILLVPLPHQVSAPFVVTPGLASTVYVQVGGYVTPLVAPGTDVPAGTVLARLENPELQLEVARAEGDLRLQETRMRWLTSQRVPGSASGKAIPAAEDAVRSAGARLATLAARAADLELRSPAAGRVLPARNLPRRPWDAIEPGAWSGTPLDPENRGVWLPEQTQLCWVGTAEQLRMVVMVPQYQIDLIDADAPVTLIPVSAPDRRRSGRVVERSASPVLVVAREFRVNRLIATRPEHPDRPLETMFRAEVELTDGDGIPLPVYSTGTATIACQRMSLVSRIWRALCHTFSFRL